MFRTISKRVPKSSDYDERTWKLEVYKRVLNGTLYDCMPYEFHEDKTDADEYIPLRDRSPSVRYNLCRQVVEDSVSLLFSEGHFPTFDCLDKTIRDTLSDIVKEAGLNQVMVDAAIRGSIGSIAVLMRVIKGRLFFSALDTLYLTPEWDAEAPGTLLSVTEKRKVGGRTLQRQGYAIDEKDADADFWFQRAWDREYDTWFVPWKVGGADRPRSGSASLRAAYGLRQPEDYGTSQWGVEEKPKVDNKNTVRHNLGFVPMVWVRNLPGGDEIDGDCTFRAAIETQIEIEYQLSQAGRGLKYSSDPLMMVREPATPDGDIVRDGTNALVVSEKGDAKLLEIGGTASSAVIEYVRTLREFALENIHGSRASPERMTAAQSGRALELMNQGLIWLADNLRISYGEFGLLQLAKMIVAASNKYALTVMSEPIEPMDMAARVSLKWPRWYPPTADDRSKDAATLSVLGNSGHISRETAVQSIADGYDIEDVPAELNKIAADEQAAMERAMASAAQIKATETLPE